MKTEKTQEVRVQVDVSLTLSTKYDAEAVHGIVVRGVKGMFPNNHKVFQIVRFAEEAAIYSKGRKVRWETIVHEAIARQAEPPRNLR